MKTMSKKLKIKPALPLKPHLNQGRQLPPPGADDSLTPINQKECDLSYLDNQSDVFLSFFNILMKQIRSTSQPRDRASCQRPLRSLGCCCLGT